MISIKGIRKRFEGGGGAAALDGVSADIEKGSFFTLLGPSGCGKSTLLRCLAGLETPDAGEIKIGDTLVFSAKAGIVVPTNRRNIGMVFQSYAIWPHMTVYGNVAFPLEVNKKSNIRKRVIEVLSLVGLADLEDRNASRLSGGQQQRVALARAVAADPDILLLDEPLSNLDAALRDQMRGELLNLQRTLGVTTVYVTHDQAEALSMSDRIAVMSNGRLVEIATPEELYHRPATVFTAQFIGGANIIEGMATASAQGLTSVQTEFGTLLSSHRANDRVKVFLRPEKISLVAERTAEPPPLNRLACVIRRRRFAGHEVELDLISAAATTGTILRCRCAPQFPTSEGDRVEVTVEPSDVHMFVGDRLTA